MYDLMAKRYINAIPLHINPIQSKQKIFPTKAVGAWFALGNFHSPDIYSSKKNPDAIHEYIDPALRSTDIYDPNVDYQTKISALKLFTSLEFQQTKTLVLQQLTSVTSLLNDPSTAVRPELSCLTTVLLKFYSLLALFHNTVVPR